jgi:hypothetical protein
MFGEARRGKSTVQTEILGMKVVGMLFATLGWFMREQPIPDQGIDAQVEAATPQGRPNGGVIGLQIKSGSSYFKYSTPGGWWFYPDTENLRYWLNHQLNVAIVLYDPDRNIAYWQAIEQAHIRKTKGGEFRIFIPEEQVLGPGAVPDLLRLANENLLQRSKAGSGDPVSELRAEYDVGLAWILESGDRLYVEVEESLHSKSGRASLRVVSESDFGTIEIARDWPTFYLRGNAVGDAVTELFPWADVSIDRGTYDKHDEMRWRAERCTWNGEYEEWDETEDFSTWADRTLTDELRPFAESTDGSRAYWRLSLALNSLGQETLQQEVDDERWEDLLALDREEAERELVQDGWYAGDYVEIGPGGLNAVERVVFQTREGDDVLAAEDTLWSEAELQPVAAAAILEHAVGGPVSASTAKLFADRFASVFDDGRGEWTISYADVASWVNEVGVSPLPTRRPDR